ncbi:uncharacterized protein LOC130666523 isoform X1 [Microplitis mediator]|uniref:uncharacterized protein LOC130666523 isoform X1 n=1 Tax=Microplitis mediator TaxID=375433 RepID=UPI002552F271|nr:uncharacterized protein LOC130666523 isoform X1 [Microplitis mediator]
MYSQRQYYFSRFARSHPILKFINVYDRQSFIREYILDNIFICIFAYIFFYITLWYANRVIKRIEKSNQEMLITVADNRSKLSDVIALKNKRQEYEEVVMKAKGAQRITTRHLENEIKKINYELMITTDKLEALEKMLLKMNFSGRQLKTRAIKSLSLHSRKVNARKIRTLSQTRLKMSRLWNRRSRQQLRRHVNTVSLSLDRLRDEVRHLESDSSNVASAEISSDASSYGNPRGKVRISKILCKKKIPLDLTSPVAKSLLTPIFQGTRAIKSLF